MTDRTISSRSEFETECQRIRKRGWAISFGEREPTAFR
ncbi:MAG: hypothetical protein IMW91_10835 [Firmicutes bacterium]|nr:hypothetical protein [Bacillota bacterium]